MSLPKNLYIGLPGSVTGDLWHVAAAEILSSINALPGYKLVALIAITEKPAKPFDPTSAEQKALDEEWEYGKVTFNYLKKIGLDCLLVKCSGTPGKRNLENTIAKQVPAELDKAFDKQLKVDLKGKSDPFDALVPTARLFFPFEERKVRLMTATTIAMNILQKNILENRGPETRAHLATRLCTPDKVPIDNAIETLATEKKTALNKLITAALATPNPKTPNKNFTRVVLENYRRGLVNAQTDSNKDLSKQLIEQAAMRGYAVITIPAVLKKAQLEELQKDRDELKNDKTFPVLANSIFDFYGRGSEPPAPYPGVDSRAQARFWGKVAEDKNQIFGVYGGRSGSLDIAAFCGVYSFFWDEPWIKFAAGFESTGLQDDNNFKKCIGQVPQCLRSLQLSVVADTGLPTAKDATGNAWTAIGPSYVTSWLDQKNDRTRYPPCPITDKWILTKSLDEFRAFDMEKDQDPKIKAETLDNMIYISGKKVKPQPELS
ncbi:MAG: hypothetical protein Q9195_006102 [Heterodermia aff. obscurata]